MTTTTKPGNHVVETKSTERSTLADHEKWIDKYNRLNRVMQAEKMKEHLTEYRVFRGVWRHAPGIDEEDLPLLWTTWCIRRGKK